MSVSLKPDLIPNTKSCSVLHCSLVCSTLEEPLNFSAV